MALHIGIDVGGTFTDLFAIDDATGRIISEKADTTLDVVSGVIAAISQCNIDPKEVKTFVFGSTTATNALIERKTEPVAFLGTQGFTDVLEIRRTWREHLFGWKWDRPAPLVPHDLRFGIGGRIDWQGEEIAPLDVADLQDAIKAIQLRGIKSVAVSLLFSFLNPKHEHAVRDLIQAQAPEIDVVLSSDVNPEIKEYERASTTVITASLKPLVERVLGQLEQTLRDYGITARPQVIKSNGGIMSAVAARAKPLEMIRSGPAGGVASALRLSRSLGLPNLITVDIGGTTADVAVVTAGEATYTRQTDLEWDIPIRMAMADVRSVGAGGGSIAALDTAGRLKVGPESAGSRPGPVSYSRGGTEPTVTDAALVAGLLDPSRFLDGRMVVDGAAAAKAIETKIAAPLQMTTTNAASGILRLAEMRMAQLIGEMTVQVGLDPRDYVLVGFGGAGPLFTAMLAREIEAKGAIIPTYPAVWSAFGGLFADIVHDYSRSYITELGGLDMAKFNEMANELVSLSLLDLARDGVDQADAERSFALDVRYQGQSHELTVPLQGSIPFDERSIAEAGRLFDELHERTYSHRRDDQHLLVTIRLMSRARRKLALPSVEMPTTCSSEPARIRQIHLYGHDEPIEAAVFVRAQLAPGFSIVGPAIVEEPQSSTFLPPDMKLSVGQSGELLIERR